ncbi:retrovirus-related Pol polyprotein from transposon 17.6 [Trichonephila clavipes]|nr:retrovirus-related Pol polyprotein from transposon 17.6 [Trichonephila clavipes]
MKIITVNNYEDFYSDFPVSQDILPPLTEKDFNLSDRNNTAFSTPDGDKYELNRLCFGLKNSPKAFQSIAQEVLGDLLHNGALVYIDDIILFTKTVDEHFELFVTPEGILIDKDKSVSVNDFPVPTDQKQIKSFLGCCNFYRRYIKNFAKRALPLTNLLRKDTPFEWTSETQGAFDDIKKAILNPPVLALPDPNAELQITTDASSRGIGTVLEQKYLNSESYGHSLSHKRHISSYSAHVNGRVEKPNQSLANILESISQNTNDWDEQLPHTMLALNSAIHEATYTSPFFLEHDRDIRLSYTYEKNSDTPQNRAGGISHVDLSTRATKQHHYDYKIGSLCFIKTPNIKSNLSPKLRPKFEGNRDYTGMWVRRGSSNLMAGKVVFFSGLLNPISVVDLMVMNP